MPTGLLQPYIDQIKSAKQIWENVRHTAPTSIPVNGYSIEPQHISRWFDELIPLFEFAEQQENPDRAMFAIHMPGIVQQCQQLSAHIAGLASNPAAYMPGLLQMLWGLRSAVLWLVPVGATWEGWASRSAEIQQTLQSISTTHSLAFKQIGDIQSLQTQFNALQSSLPNVQELADNIQKVLQEVSNAKTSAEGSAVNAAAEKEKIDTQLKALAEAVGTQNIALEALEKKKVVIEQTLAGASAVSLGLSFDTQGKEHTKSKSFWQWSFYGGLGVMVGIQLLAFFYPTYFPTLSSETWLVWLLSRIAIASPVIWFTWFAALQYSRAMRLAEDYAFKTAAAKSFYGYRQEVDADKELVKMLQEISIKNFGSNPLRLLGKDDHGSPTHELFEKFISKMDADSLAKFGDALKEAAVKITKK